VALVRANGYRISTGFVGTPLVCDALCSAGEYASAYRLLLERECPSWLYPVTMGSVADWLHRTVAGLAPAAAGKRQVSARPLLSHQAGLVAIRSCLVA